jgi:hypothetical protein
MIVRSGGGFVRIGAGCWRGGGEARAGTKLTDAAPMAAVKMYRRETLGVPLIAALSVPTTTCLKWQRHEIILT